MPAVARESVRTRPQAASPVQARTASRSPSGGRGAARPQARSSAPGRGGFSVSPTLVVWIVVALAALALVAALVTSSRARSFAGELKARVDAQTLSAGFGVRRVLVQGATPRTQAMVLAAAGVRPGQPLTGIDLSDVRGRVEAISSLSHVRVVRMLPDTLVISVSERPRLAVWQHSGRLSVIDPEGRIIADAAANAYPNLPLVVGVGAESDAGAMVAVLRDHPRIAAAVQALVRVDGRRWDLRLRDGGVVMLPATDAAVALTRLDQLDRQARLLELGFERIDLRLPDVIAVRPRGSAATPARPVAAAATPSTPAADAAASER